MKIKNYLIASETNDYRPFITSSTAMIFFMVIVWGLKIILPVGLTFAQGYLDTNDIMSRINDERRSRTITTVATNSKLITAASAKASDMLSRSYFSHIDPDGNYVWPRIEAAGYKPYTTLGENLAMDFTSAADLVTAWMNSPTHRANMLNEAFRDQGLASASGLYEPGHNTTIVVSLFGKLSSSQVATPTQTVAQSNSTSPSSTLSIGKDVQINVTQVSGHNLVEMTVPISGNPTLVTAKLLTQSISLLSQKDTGNFSGTFTFNLSDTLNGNDITVEARNVAGQKTISSFPLSGLQTLPTAEPTGSQTGVQGAIPISQEAMIIKILRIIFGVLSVIYLGFLVTDWIIIRRSHIERPGLHLAPQIVVFLLIAFVNLFVKF